MGAAGFGLIAALGFAAGSIVTKRLVGRFDFAQLIGPAFALNAMWLFPLVPFVEWKWTGPILLLHAVSVAAISLTSWAIFDLFQHGAASAVTTAQATSPLATVLGVAVLVPATFSWVETAVAVVVVGAVTAALSDSFPSIGRARALALAAAVAGGTGLTTVFARQLVDEGLGLVEIYTTRTVVAAILFLVLFPPLSIDRSAMPALLLRSAVMSTAWAASILGVQVGSPTVVQTMAATTPLWVLSWEFSRSGRRPPARVLVGALLVAAGVVVVLIL
ncbi:MAG: EamA family transporter [Acidimicrobiia bacterium]